MSSESGEQYTSFVAVELDIDGSRYRETVESAAGLVIAEQVEIERPRISYFLAGDRIEVPDCDDDLHMLVDGQKVSLGPKAYPLIRLLSAPDRIDTEQTFFTLLTDVWGDDVTRMTPALREKVISTTSKLRICIKDPALKSPKHGAIVSTPHGFKAQSVLT